MSVFMVPSSHPVFPSLGGQVCDWIEDNLCFGPGDLRGEPAVIDDEKRALIWRMYEVFPKSHPQAGRRRFKRAGISLPKGLAKTELAAWLAAAELHPEAPVRCVGWKGKEPVGGPVNDPFVVLVAYTEEQSDELCYGALKVILEESQMNDVFDIGLERIARLQGGGKAVSLAGSPNARDGARTTFQVYDEPLALWTKVPTPDGWKTIAEIQAGCRVYGRDGRAVNVLGVSDVKRGRPCYRVTFDNGASVVTDASHRWTVIDWKNRPAGERQVSTQDMFDGGLMTSYGRRWRLPRGRGFEGVHTELPIDPYLLGLWIGDGATHAGYIHSDSRDYTEIAMPFAHTVSQDTRPGVVRWLPTGLRTRLRNAGILGNKHVPDIYLFASREQRIELLRGLMDSDGHTTKHGNCCFVQKHYDLCAQIAVLVRSLGVNATVIKTADARSATGWMYKVNFSPDFCPFKLPRKANAATWRPRVATWWPSVVSIEPVESEPVKCIAVESEDHLFVFGEGMHLTHNTHWHTLPRLKQAHQTMQANLPKRKLADAWALEITTAPEPGGGSIAEDTMQYAEAVRDGRIQDSTLFFFHRQASDVHDLTTLDGARAAVIEASGPAAAWRDIDGIMAYWADPTTDRSYFERVYCNRLVQSSSQAFDVERWKALAAPTMDVAPRAKIVLGFDGSIFHDATGIVATDIHTGYQWVPGVWERPARASETWQVPADEVNDCVRELFARYDVWRLYADPPYWQAWIAAWTGEFGKERVHEWWTNQRKRMTAALEAFDTAIREGAVSHDGDEHLTRHIGNARRHDLPQRDEHGRQMWLIKKERPDSPKKIDLAMAAVLSWEARSDAVAAGVLREPKPQLFFMGGAR